MKSKNRDYHIIVHPGAQLRLIWKTSDPGTKFAQ